MRKSHDGLAALCDRYLKSDPMSGDLFLFFNKKGNRVKVLYWDGNGFCLFYKRLESGKFSKLETLNGHTPLTLEELALVLDGVDLKGKLPLSPQVFNWK